MQLNLFLSHLFFLNRFTDCFVSKGNFDLFKNFSCIIRLKLCFICVYGKRFKVENAKLRYRLKICIIIYILLPLTFTRLRMTHLVTCLDDTLCGNVENEFIAIYAAVKLLFSVYISSFDFVTKCAIKNRARCSFYRPIHKK